MHLKKKRNKEKLKIKEYKNPSTNQRKNMPKQLRRKGKSDFLFCVLFVALQKMESKDVRHGR